MILNNVIKQQKDEIEEKEKRKINKKNMGVSLCNRIMGWPHIRSFNFDINGESTIKTSMKAFFSIPLLIFGILAMIYFITPLFYYDTAIYTEIDHF